jgi:hypothetical protein
MMVAKANNILACWVSRFVLWRRKSGWRSMYRLEHPLIFIRFFPYILFPSSISQQPPDEDNLAAHVASIEIPGREKNLFNVTNCNMVWQNMGDYLAVVKVTRHAKSKKTL